MIEVRQTAVFADWLGELRDRAARARIVARLRRVEIGNVGDVKSVGGGVNEIRVHSGPGYRLYFVWRGEVLVILLCGGSKGTQTRDISRAKALAQEV